MSSAADRKIRKSGRESPVTSAEAMGVFGASQSRCGVSVGCMSLAGGGSAAICVQVRFW
jgi:hypothetical protein